MTRVAVYSVALGVFVAATILTIVSILTPNWLNYEIRSANTDKTFKHTLGLHQLCSSASEPACRPYPTDDECKDDAFFCSMWRSSGFLMSFATIVELATLVSFLVVMAGGKYKREDGWKLIGGLLLADAVVEFAGMGLVAYLFNHDEQFAVPGWGLGWSWILCTISATVSVLVAASLAASAWVLPPEDDYEYLEDPVNDI
ncbi:hypothetical protein JX265_002779 [Neoarthrinium moseri]|uniref:Pre-mRNA splicing factor n=1 Tax=Neoarthrinium moseri TaxID=1658444 RepID=A0A9P9WSZ7_9PEZI|nr:uncharacterized protein JN550_010126 [Neoarthrinium moseri]KAI1845136.1 hypothetical protein JX266_008683 [Neoarthrinium moseri]KAI1862601.1 hypothetical protein JN550_010126 [Neoarthrinium moseri]KAI1878602.1 hypothetical protein JX265_002779 [Neoarthrinium moseri]